jgi:hypothetical protein
MEKRAGRGRQFTVPSGNGKGGGGYRWRGVEDWTPGDPRYRGAGEPEPAPGKPRRRADRRRAEPCPHCGGTGKIARKAA